MAGVPPAAESGFPGPAAAAGAEWREAYSRLPLCPRPLSLCRLRRLAYQPQPEWPRAPGRSVSALSRSGSAAQSAAARRRFSARSVRSRGPPSRRDAAPAEPGSDPVPLPLPGLPPGQAGGIHLHRPGTSHGLRLRRSRPRFSVAGRGPNHRLHNSGEVYRPCRHRSSWSGSPFRRYRVRGASR